MGVDTAWFKRKIETSPYVSMRKLAENMRTPTGKPLDISSMSNMLSGKRLMQLHEARQLADLLGVPMGEVIRRAGIPFGSRDNV